MRLSLLFKQITGVERFFTEPGGILSKADNPLNLIELFNSQRFGFPFSNQLKSKRDLTPSLRSAERKEVGGTDPRKGRYRTNIINQIGGWSLRE